LLRKVSLHGFKSFCDRTEIVLGSGITAIVGPNGCGKSNIADAIRWVLGEQNARVLRCNRLEDLIFSGTVTRKAMGMAEVRLFLDGIQGDNEREIQRRYARDGSSEYRMNGKPSRWKDVVDALLGTGLSHTGYVVIGQGMIQELAGGKPEDRRMWLEEASGVARFKLDKRHIEDRLSLARSNVTRLSDLLVELSAQKGKLLMDVELTRKYHRLMAERRNVELVAWLHQEAEERKKVAALVRRLEKWENDMLDAERALSSFKEEMTSLASSLPPLKGRLKDLCEERDALLSRLLSLEKEREKTRARLAFAARETETREVRVGVLEKDLARVETEIGASNQRSKEVSARLEEALEKVREAEETRKAAEALWKELGEKVIEIRGQMVTLTSQLSSLSRSKEETRESLENVRKEIADTRDAVVSKERELRGEKANLELSREELSRVIAEKAKAGGALDSLSSRAMRKREEIEKVKGLEKSAETRLSLVSARKRLLEEMERTYEGYGKGPKAVLEAGRKGLLRGILGSTGDLFSCEPQYIQALSASLGGALEYIIVEDESAAKKAIAFLKETRSGRCTFLPLTLLRPRDLHPRAVEALGAEKRVRPLVSVVNYAPELEVAARYLFGRVVLAETIEDALSFMKASSWTTRAVTLGGETIDPGGSMTGGEPPRHQVVFQRKRELAEIAKEEPQLRADLSRLKRESEALEKEMREIAAQTEKSRQEKAAAESREVQLRQYIEKTQDLLSRIASEITEGQGRIASLEEKEKELQSRLSEISLEEEEISREISGKEEELSRYEGKLKGSFLGDETFSRNMQKLTWEKESLEREASSLSRRLESLSVEKSSLEKNLEEENKEVLRLKCMITELRDQDSRLCGEATTVEGRLSILKEEIRQVQREIEASETRLAYLEGETKRFEKEKDHLATRIAEGKAELIGLQEALSATQDTIRRKFGLDGCTAGFSPEEPHGMMPGMPLPDGEPHGMTQPAVLCQRLSREEALSMVEELDRQIESLGTLNLKAEEETKALQERLEFIEREKGDVEEAIQQLVAAKEHLEKEIRSSFLDTYEKVSKSFGEVFAELFGGGSGTLSLNQDYGVEVTVQVPGRRGKEFNLLSGGERSLCGIALVFSILSVRPSPLIVLDEVDSSLDGANVLRFAQFLKRYSKDTQFIVITHKEATMEVADIIYGVTMEEPGVSKVFGMRLENG